MKRKFKDVPVGGFFRNGSGGCYTGPYQKIVPVHAKESYYPRNAINMMGQPMVTHFDDNEDVIVASPMVDDSLRIFYHLSGKTLNGHLQQHGLT